MLKLKAKSVPMAYYSDSITESLSSLNHYWSLLTTSLPNRLREITIMTQFPQTTSSVHTRGTISYHFKWIFSIGPSCWRKPVSHACNLTDIYGSGVLFTPPQQRNRFTSANVSIIATQEHVCNTPNLQIFLCSILYFQKSLHVRQLNQSDQQFT